MYKILLTHYDGGVMYKAGQMVDTVKRAAEKLKAGLICEVKISEPDERKLPIDKPAAKRIKRKQTGHDQQ